MSDRPDPIADPRAGPAAQRWLTPLLLALVALVALAPTLLADRFPRTHEGLRYHGLTLLFAEALRDGQPYPRWLPDLAGGLGYPTFVFYQPLFFYVAAACLALPGVTIAAAPALAAYGFVYAGAGGIYLAARGWLATRAAALAVAALFVLTPFAFLDLHVRGDLSELAAMMLAPWPLALLLRGERALVERHPALASFAGLAVSLALILYAHPLVAGVYLPVLVALVVGRWCGMDAPLRRAWTCCTFGSFLAGVALTAPYWVPALQLRDDVHLARALDGIFDPAQHVVTLRELVSRAWTFGTSQGRLRPGGVAMSFQLGLPHLLLAVAGAALGWRRPWVVGLAVAYALLAVAMTPLALPAWRADTPLRTLQFPWRLLAVLAVPQVMLAAAALARVRRPRAQALVAWACALAAAAWYAPMFRASDVNFYRDATDTVGYRLDWADAAAHVHQQRATLVADRGETFTIMNEFEPVWVHPAAAPPARSTRPFFELLAPADDRAALQADAAHAPFALRATLDSPAPATLVIQQFYFPGWRVTVNDVAVSDEALRAGVLRDGRLSLALPAGRSEVRAAYVGPPGWVGRSIASLAAAGVGLGLAAWGQRRRARDATALPTADTSARVAAQP